MRKVVLAAAGLLGCSEQGLSSGAEGNRPLAPDIVVDPLLVDFGVLPEHAEASRTVRISNVGDEALDVSRVQPGPNAAFGVPDLGATFELLPGESALQTIHYTATNAHDESWLQIVSDDPDSPTLDVPLFGGALVPELTIEPNPLVFGEVPCSEQATLALRNTGGAPLTLTGVVINGASFASEGSPVVPITLAPGVSAAVLVGFSPGPGAGLRTGEVLVDSDDRRGVQTGALEGSGVAPPSRVDSFDQVENDWTKVDLTFFVDKSGSMGDDAANLASNFGAFLDILLSAGIDYQIVVLTADDGCPDHPRITPATLDPEGVFLTATEGIGGVYYESGMIVTRNALDETVPGGCNDGLLRPGVLPIAVMVSDEPEQSPGGYLQYLLDMQVIAPDLVISAVVGQPTSPCAADGTGYHEAVLATGGVDLEICDADWGSYFFEFLGTLEPPLLTFALTATPDPATLVVTVDGGPAVGWSYDPADNAVVFTELTPPPPSSVIEVAYDELVACP